MAFQDKYFLELSNNPVRFDTVSTVTNVFFDESNTQNFLGQLESEELIGNNEFCFTCNSSLPGTSGFTCTTTRVFAVRSGGETGVVVKGPTERTFFTFRLKDRGPLISIKFSYKHKVLAMQRSDRSVEFSNFGNGEVDPIGYSQTCKGRNNKIVTFHWLSINEIVFVTENGIEFYQINTEKRFLKLTKSHALTIHWSVFSPEASVLLVSSGTGNLLVPFHVKNGQITKLQKFEVEPPKTGNPLPDRDVTLLSLYNALYAGVLRHPGKNGNEKCTLDLYLLNKDSPVIKSFVLQLGMVGRFALNVVDNLVIAHHQVSKTSVVFDVKLPGISRSNVVCLEPILGPLSIKPFFVKTQEFDLKNGTTTVEKKCELYSQTWIVFGPDIVIDAAMGLMWRLRLNLSHLIDMFHDKSLLVDFLLLRKKSKHALFEVLKSALPLKSGVPLVQVGSLFSKLNQVYKDYIEAEIFFKNKLQSQPDVPHIPHHHEWVVLDQNDVNAQVLKPFAENDEIPGSRKVAVLCEYVRSLNAFKVKIKYFVYELLIHTLVCEHAFFHLQQLLRRNVIQDSKQVACCLLALESVHPPCFDLALDMLKRLATSDEQVVEVMLSKQMILPALRFIRHVGMHDLVPARKFLAAARHDDRLFYSVYKFFEARNLRLNGKPEFTIGERCSEFMDYYVTKFSTDVIL